MHYADTVGDGEGFVLIVRDEERCGAGLLQDRAHLEGKPFAQLDVEIRKRLVEQQQMRARRQRAGERDALLLAAGKFVRIFVVQTRQADQRQQLLESASSVW